MKKITVILFMLLSFLLVAPRYEASNLNYSVRANIPENQINKKATHFDLKMQPGQEQELSITFKNFSAKENTILIDAITATTNKNGVIDYTNKDEKVDNSLTVNFSEIIDYDHEVVLKPNEEKDVTFKLRMPKDEFSGVVLGGIQVSEKNQLNNNENEEGVAIANQYSYVIGVKLTENDDKVTPDLVLNEIKPGLENYHTVVTANLQNPKAEMLRDLAIKAEVRKKGETDVLRTIEREDLAMAPNSNFNFIIDWQNQELKQGSYTLTLEATAENDFTRSFTKDFEIGRAEARALNKEAVELPVDDTRSIIPILIGLMVVLILIICIIVFYIIKKQKEQNMKKQNRKYKKKKKEIGAYENENN